VKPAAGELDLETPVRYVKGVGPTRAEQLAELGIETVEDLLTYYPRRFDLRRQAQAIATLRGDEQAATIAGQVTRVGERAFGKRPFFQCVLADETGRVDVRWFHGGYLRDRVKPGLQLAVSGSVSTYKGRMQFINPRCQVLWDPEAADLSQDELLPVYPASAKLGSGHIGQIIRGVLPLAESLIPEWFPPEHLSRRGLPSRRAAVAAMHRPEDKAQWAEARRRLAYDECLLMQLGIALLRMRQVSRPAHGLPNSAEIDRRIRARFPFKLTEAQNRAAAEIAADRPASDP
jgi:ATP-dependent DNA helicase RecG